MSSRRDAMYDYLTTMITHSGRRGGRERDYHDGYDEQTRRYDL